MGSTQLIENLRTAEQRLFELGQGHLGSIRHDAEELLPSINRNSWDRGQSCDVRAWDAGGYLCSMRLIRNAVAEEGSYGKRMTVCMAICKGDAPAQSKAKPLQTVEVQFDSGDGTFAVSIDDAVVWKEEKGKTTVLPEGALSVAVQKLMAISARLRAVHNPQVLESVEQARAAIRDQVERFMLVPWESQ